MTPNVSTAVPSRKDIAEFFRIGILNRLFEVTALSPWIDGIIAADDAPPSSALDLAINTDWQETIALLQSVPGNISGVLPRDMLASLIRRKWLAKQVTGREVTRLVFALLPDGWQSTGYMTGIFQFDHNYFDCLDTGHCTVTEEQTDQMLTEFLSYYAAFDDMIPPWIN